MLALSASAMLIASFCAMVLIPRSEPEVPAAEPDFLMDVLTNVLGLFIYGSVLVVAGYSRRILQTLTAIIGCGAILTMLYVAEFVFFRPFLGTEFAGLVAVLIIFWSVRVDGHIISRAIDKHWLIGLAVAIAAFVLQFIFQSLATRS